MTKRTERPADELLDRAEQALDDGDAERALNICREILSADPRHTGALFLMADAERTLGDLEGAEADYRTVTRLLADHSPGWSALASVLFDSLKFEEARVATLRALRADPSNGEAYWVRALIRERRSDARGAERDYWRAHRLAPESFPLPQPLSDAMLTSVVEQAKQDLHPSIQTYLDQVPFLVEDVPSEAVCLEFDPPALPSDIVGIFSGTPLSERSGDDPWSQMPATITLFRRNLERMAHDMDHLVDEIRTTILHEVGHYLGLDEDDMVVRGID